MGSCRIYVDSCNGKPRAAERYSDRYLIELLQFVAIWIIGCNSHYYGLFD